MIYNEQSLAYFIAKYQGFPFYQERRSVQFDAYLRQFNTWKLINLQDQFDTNLCQFQVRSSIVIFVTIGVHQGDRGGDANRVLDCNRVFYRLQSCFLWDAKNIFKVLTSF